MYNSFIDHSKIVSVLIQYGYDRSYIESLDKTQLLSLYELILDNLNLH